MNKGLIALMLGGLGLGMTEFVMMGILPVLATHFHISIPQAGNFITFYALGVVVGAPTLVLIAGYCRPKNILLLLMVLFTIFNSAAMLVHSYHEMVLIRFLAGLPHGAFFGVGAVVASRLAEPGKSARAIALMFTGLTIANIVAVPLGTFIGFHFSWQLTFMMIGIIGLITLSALLLWLPNLERTDQHNLKNELSFFTQGRAWLVMAIICFGTSGLFAWFSYIAPLLIHVSHFAPGDLAYFMLLAGVGMFVGNIIGGRLADRFGALRATIMTLVAMFIILFFVHISAQHQGLVLIATFLAGAAGLANAAPVQMLMITCFKESQFLASSLSPACFNVGNAMGASLGGVPLFYGASYTSPEWIGMLLILISLGLIALLIALRRNHVAS